MSSWIKVEIAVYFDEMRTTSSRRSEKVFKVEWMYIDTLFCFRFVLEYQTPFKC